MRMRPLDGSMMRFRVIMSVLLPHPVRPATPTFSRPMHDRALAADETTTQQPSGRRQAASQRHPPVNHMGNPHGLGERDPEGGAWHVILCSALTMGFRPRMTRSPPAMEKERPLRTGSSSGLYRTTSDSATIAPLLGHDPGSLRREAIQLASVAPMYH